MKHLAYLVCAAFLLTITTTLAADEPTPPKEKDHPAQDSRLGKQKDFNGYFPFKPPATKEAWEARRKELREQVLVALGLWPMPEKKPLNPVIHGKIDRGEYTVEKVYFASHPGFYVTGNLYRPKMANGGRQPDKKLPAVLCPHGHWANGRFLEVPDKGEKGAEAQIKQGAEKTLAGARYPLQARCAQLARMGCIVFHYDMIGYADNKHFDHRKSFVDADAELHLLNVMGLQTWNSIRALDFLESLPEVDPKRIGVTGASGGGTQTFILCAVDDRPTVAFPAVMVSTAMQGGCVCENCSYLRQGTGNVELAALFAPKPLGMTGADDWTKEIETKGLPELKALYKLYGAEDKVMAKAFPQFKHNYNQVSREVMYNWFNKHLTLGQPEPVVEKPFVPVPPKELSVFDDKHPRPNDAVDQNQLRKYLKEISNKQIEALRPQDTASFRDYQRVIGTALRVMVCDRLPKPEEVESKVIKRETNDGYHLTELVLGRKHQGECIPATFTVSAKPDTVVVWIHPDGKNAGRKELFPLAVNLLDRKAGILSVEVFHTGNGWGARPAGVNPTYAGYTFGYNRPLVANRVHDILTAVAYAKSIKGVKKVHLVGFEEAGPWVLMARALCGPAVDRTVVDMNGFRFDKVRQTSDEMMLPGALKYGGLPAFAGLCAPGELFIHNHQATGLGHWIKPAYEAAGAKDKLHRKSNKANTREIFDWLTR